MQRDYRDKQIVIVGAGSTGRSLARYFLSREARLVLSDSRPASCFTDLAPLEAAGVRLDLGGHTEALFLAADLIVVSPGVPLEIPVLQKSRQQGIPLVGEIEIAWHELTGTLVAITGTNGKSTVTSLIGAILKAWGKSAFIGGNLGTPLIDSVGSDCDWQVVELSSFQLEAIDAFRADYALLLNISEDHLDRYPDMAAYIAAKARIFENQQPEDVAVLNFDDARVMAAAESVRSRRVCFSSKTVLDEGMSLVDDKIIWRWEDRETLFPANELLIRGRHNQENVMAAMIPMLLAGCPAVVAWQAVKNFSGLAHRMEYLGDYAGARWYNDSKGTNIGSVVKSLSGLDRPVVLIAGGKDKLGDLSDLVAPVREKVSDLILIGAAAERMAAAFAGLTMIHRAGSMHEAVQVAARCSRPGATVLLSPGCSSFDMFENFAVRGEIFASAFRALGERGRHAHGS